MKDNKIILLQTGKSISNGDMKWGTTYQEIHIGFPDGDTECGKVLKVLGQKIILTRKNIDLISCAECKEAAENILKYEEVQQSA